MERAVERDVPSRAWTFVAVATVAAVAAYYAVFALGRPYHMDTVLYIQDIRGLLRDGTPPGAFPSRIGTVWAYLPGYAALGEAGLRWTNIVTVTATLALYLLVVRRDFGTAEAWPSAVTLATVPAVVLTVTHLKEDMNALVFVAAALAVAGPGIGLARAAGAGVLFGLSLICKEYPVMFAPFLAGHVYLAAARPSSWRGLVQRASLRAAAPVTLAFVGVALGTALVLNRRHFGGMVSSLGPGGANVELVAGPVLASYAWSIWREAALHAALLPAFLAIAVAVACWRAQPRVVLWAGAGLAVALALVGNNSSRARLVGPAFFLLLPPSWCGARLAIRALARAVKVPAPERLSAGLTAALALGLAAWNVRDVAPTLAFREAYPPQAAYFEPLRSVLPKGAILYGMDSCTLATYFAGRPCRAHPVDPDPATARAFVSGLLQEARRRPVLLLPDFGAYDLLGTIASEVRSRARLDLAYASIGEDFHAMTWAPSVAADAARLERSTPGCRRVRSESRPFLALAEPGFELGRTIFSCDGREQAREYVLYRGHVTELALLEVFSVVPR